MAQSLGEIRELLKSHGLHPKKKFGQNFLHDGNHMRRILDAADIQPQELVLEVGPGTGALTERLVEAGARVVAVEIDADLEPILVERLSDRVTLIIDSILSGKHAINPKVIAALGGEPFKLVANLPYNVASPMLANLAVDHPSMVSAVVMVQKEVADRLTAEPGGKAYGALGVLVQAMCEVERVGVLSPRCFWPPPQVASSVVKLTRRARPLTDDPHRLGAFLQRLFSQRRKQLGHILGRDTLLPEGVSASDRPERLTVAQCVELMRASGG